MAQLIRIILVNIFIIDQKDLQIVNNTINTLKNTYLLIVNIIMVRYYLS